MKFKHKVLISLVGLSLLLPMCAKQSESVDSTEQQQPIAIQEVKQPTLAVHNFCKRDGDRINMLVALKDGTCQEIRKSIDIATLSGIVTPTEIKVSWKDQELALSNVLIINRVTKDSSHIFTLTTTQQQNSFDAPVVLEEIKQNDNTLIIVATTQSATPVTYAFTLEGDPSLLPSAAGY